MPKQIRFEGEEEKLLNKARELLKNEETGDWEDAKKTVRTALEYFLKHKFKETLSPTTFIRKELR